MFQLHCLCCHPNPHTFSCTDGSQMSLLSRLWLLWKREGKNSVPFSISLIPLIDIIGIFTGGVKCFLLISFYSFSQLLRDKGFPPLLYLTKLHYHVSYFHWKKNSRAPEPHAKLFFTRMVWLSVNPMMQIRPRNELHMKTENIFLLRLEKLPGVKTDMKARAHAHMHCTHTHTHSTESCKSVSYIHMSQGGVYLRLLRIASLLFGLRQCFPPHCFGNRSLLSLSWSSSLHPIL